MGKGKKMSKKYNSLEASIRAISNPMALPLTLAEDGHTDVASALNGVKVARSALDKMETELGKMTPEGELPSWWTNKVAIAVDKLDGMADYLDTQVEVLDKEDEPKVKEIVKKLKGASKAHAGQADDLEKAVKEEVELDEAIPKDTTYGVVVNGKYIAKGSKSDMRSLAKKKGGQLVNAPGAKVGDKEGKAEEAELDEDAKMAKQSDDNLKSLMKKIRDAEKKDPKMPSTQHMIKRISKEMKKRGLKEEIDLDEAKSSTGYELYHKDFSSAMQHAYSFAKKKYGITVDKKEIDDKVATGPKKPSKDKTNKYRLLGTDGKKAVQIQVTNLDGKRFELNMYKEEVLPAYESDSSECVSIDEESRAQIVIHALKDSLQEVENCESCKLPAADCECDKRMYESFIEYLHADRIKTITNKITAWKTR